MIVMVTAVITDGKNNVKTPHNNDVLISVIVPVFNVEAYLERCLDSILNNTFRNIEIICVDDGSTDKSGTILNRYAKNDSRIVVIHKENGGLSSARNTAFPYIKGKFVYFVDADDWIDHDALEECLSYMVDDIDIVISGAQIDYENITVTARSRSLEKLCQVKESGSFIIDDILINQTTSMVWGKLLRYEIIKNYRLFFLDGRFFEDCHFTIEYLVHAKKCYFISKNLYHYVQRENSIMNGSIINHSEDSLYIFDYLYKRLESFNLLKKHVDVLSKRYDIQLKLAYTQDSFANRCKIKKLATELAQYYNTDFFKGDMVMHVKNKDYGLVPAFDEEVFIVLDSSYNDIDKSIDTIRSLFSQTYKLPKVLLNVDAETVVNQEELLNSIVQQGFTELIDYQLFIEFNKKPFLAKIINKLKNQVVLTVQNGVVYPDNWLRCMMSAYFDHRDAFDVACYGSGNELDEENLFKECSVINFDANGKIIVFKSKKIVVSLTSYPARIDSVALTIETIYKQTKLPDEVVLWLAESDFPKKLEDLPETLLFFVKNKNLVIRWCNVDLKPHNKYFWAFKEFHDALVITVDDDILYHEHLIENLYFSYLLHPSAVSAARVHLMPMSKDGGLLPYKVWPKEIDAYISKPSMLFCATGVGGVLYPTKLFAKAHNLLDVDLITRSCLYQDDFWLKIIELISDVPVVVAEEYKGLCYIPDTQDVGLWHNNVDEGGNDRQLLQIQEVLGSLYGKDFFTQKLRESTIGEKKAGEEILCDLINYYQRLVAKRGNEIKMISAKYSTLRVDIRNKGETGCNVVEQTVNPAPVSLRRPDWLPGGITIESVSEKMTVVFQCQGNGELEIGLMGRDVKNEAGKRYPVWIDCTYFAVNGKVIFEDTKTVCHDKRYVYRKPVVDGEIVKLEVTWSECRSSNVLDEYRQLQAELKNEKNEVVTAQKQINTLHKQYEKYSTLRMDIRNRGDEGCDVIEQGIVPQPLAVHKPEWLPGGMTVESIAERMSVAVQCKGDGELEIGLMGRDVKNEAGKRYPVWIDCTYFAVNGEVIFEDTKTVCHDKRYVYRKPVVDGEIVKLEVAWSECRTSNVLDEYRQLQAKLKNSKNRTNQLQIELKNLNNKNDQLQRTNAKTLKDLNETQRKAAKLDKELQSVKSGWSYKIGRMVTWVPRIIKDWFMK